MTSTLQRIVPLGGLLILLVAFAWVGMSLSSFGNRPPAIEDAAATLTVGTTLSASTSEEPTTTEAVPEPAPEPVPEPAPAPQQAPAPAPPVAPQPQVYVPPAPAYIPPAAPEVIVPQAPLVFQDLDDLYDDYDDDDGDD